MTSPDDNDPVRSELDYAPPWVREQAAREQGTREQVTRDPGTREQATREQVAREPAALEPITRDQFRAALRQSAGAAVEAQHKSESRNLGDDRPWHQRALEPELVPAPPAGALNLWPMMLRLGAVCTIAAMVAAAVVFLFSPKQITHKIAQASDLVPADLAPAGLAPADLAPAGLAPADLAPAGLAPANLAPARVADNAAPPSIESSRGIPALTVEKANGVTTPPGPGQVAVAAPSQPSQTQPATATPPQLAEGEAAAGTVPKPEKPVEPPAPARQLASLPAPDSSPADIRPSPAPVVNEPAPRPVDANPASAPAPVQTAPAQAAPPNIAKPAMVLDQSEIETLIRRGKNLLNDGDFAAARVLFERAANAGSADAALALGSTYDPNVIKRLGAIMVKADVEKARQWYQLAADRGSAAASLQLANLPQSR
ncbi:MAG: hypothetical protein J2P55_10445 [Rhizobiales bacterium]|nr:hypothetical protein [Hyphomicrobiales bacterium]